MRNIILFLIFILTPAFGAMAGDIILNNQQTYAVPPDSDKVLILDLTLPENLSLIKLLNFGTAQQWDISAVYIFEDGQSSGWDGDEKEIARKTLSPFWDVEISAISLNSRIFVAVDIASAATSEKTIKPKAVINSIQTIIGFERTILAGASTPEAPSAPLAEKGQALSTSTIRWYFKDLANNEFGFKIKNSLLKITAKAEQADLAYIDEQGLEPNTCYSGRRAYTYNDRGESLPSINFAEVCTKEARPPEEVKEAMPPAVEEARPPAEASPLVPDDLSITIRQKIIEVLTQLIQLLQEKIKLLQAGLFGVFEIFTSQLELRF